MLSTPQLGRPLPRRPATMRAVWLYHAEYNLWTWIPAIEHYSHDLVRLNSLRAAGFQRVPLDSVNPSLLALHGQMWPVVSLVHALGERESWASQQVLERLAQVPVALAFTLPEDMAASLEAVAVTVGATPEGEPRKALRIAQWLPPPQFGERALVMRDGDVTARTVAALGDDARALLAEMGRRLTEMAEPAGWGPWHEGLEYSRYPGDYKRRRSDLRSQLLTRQGQAREDVRAELELLEVQRKHALDIEAQEERQARNPEAWRASVAEVAAMAQQLADLYWQVEQEADRLPTQRRVPEIPSAFDGEGMAQVPSMMPVQTVLNSYSAAAKGWQRDPDGIPTYRQTTAEHDTYIQVRGNDSGELLDEARIEQFRRQVEQLSDLDGDVFLAMLAQANTAPQANTDVWITSAQILQYRGLRPIVKHDEQGRERDAGNRTEDLTKVAQCVSRQASQWVHINSTIGEDVAGRRRKVRFSHVSKLTQIAEVVYQHELIPEPGQTGVLPIAWRYRMGTWLEPFLSGPNRKMAYLCQQALHYDPYRETWEKRLARYFVFHLRINAATGGTLHRHIRTLIDELSLPVDERHPERTRQRFEQALDRLVSDGVIDAWNYPTSNAKLPARGWLATWREWRVDIHAGAITTQRQALITARARTRRERAATLNITAERKRRETRRKKGPERT